MDSTTSDLVQMRREQGQKSHLTNIYNNTGFLDSCDSLHITYMTSTTQNISNPFQDKFDTDGISIVIDNLCYVTMSHIKQDFEGPLIKGWKIINIFDGTNMHMIYEGTITLNNNYDTCHPHQVKIITIYM